MLKEKSICEFCGKEFQQPKYKKRKSCSPECRAKLIVKTRNPGAIWSKEEEQKLTKLIQTQPLFIIIEQWNNIAKKKGWYQKTSSQIIHKIRFLVKTVPELKNNYVKLEYSKTNKKIKVSKDNWCVHDLMRTFGLKHKTRILRWKEKGLKFKEIKPNKITRYLITKKALNQFALTNPEEFWGIEKKNLCKCLKPEIASKVYKLNQVKQRTVGRPIPLVRLDRKEYYKDAVKAGTALNISSTAIRKCAKRDTPIKNGMNFFEFDYPVYWCPRDLVEEFNAIVAELIHYFYCNLRELDGYKKQSCLKVAARLSVEITLIAFRKQEKQKAKQQEVTPRSALIEFWRDKFLKNIQYVYQLNTSLIFNKIVNAIKYKVYRRLVAITNNDLVLVDNYSQEFAIFFIEKAREKYLKDSCLPLDYEPKTKIEISDLYAHIYQTLNIYIEIGKKENGTLSKISWVNIKLLHFLRKYKIDNSNVKNTSYLPEWAKHNPTEETSNQAQTEIELLLDRASKVYSKEIVDRLELFVALKLEDASDREIESCLNISSVEVQQCYNLLQRLTRDRKIVNKEKLKNLFSYHPPVNKERQKKHEDVNKYCAEFAVSLADIISSPAELTVLLRKVQEIRMLANQAIVYEDANISYQDIFK